jgi:TonB family protein
MVLRPRPIREEGRVASAWVISIVGHLVATGLGGLLVASSLGRHPAVVLSPPAPLRPGDDMVEIELPTVVDGSLVGHAPALDPEALPRGGGEGVPHLDTGRRGRGGEETSRAPAINLADRDDDLRLSSEVQSRLDRDQIQRLRASSRRASREDWRASREPMELTFLAEGRRDTPPDRPEHRRSADTDPSSGGGAYGAPQRLGGALGAGELPPGVGESPRQAGGPVEGTDRPSPGAGTRDGAAGSDHRDSARVALARPMVNQGTPSVPANLRGRPTDNVDADQEVASTVQSILHASTAGGRPGPGGGGQAGGGPSGEGGASGPGSVSHALGTGQGPGVDVDPRDRRRSEYLRGVISKVYPYTDHAMPRSAAFDGVQGVVIVTFTILSDGSVAGARVTRTSGVPELDENCRQAILRAAPYAPLPAELGTSLRWAMPLDFRNPAVRPRNGRVEP